MQKSNFFELVHEEVKRIPEGMVITYGQIARKLGTRDARRVGHALHANKDETCPYHRVVNKEGRVAPRTLSAVFKSKKTGFLPKE